MSFRTAAVGALLAFVTFDSLSSVPRAARLDETPAPPYLLPDPLLAENGFAVADPAAWESQRRPELLELFAREVYGRTPAGRPEHLRFQILAEQHGALGGVATRREVAIRLTGEEGDGAAVTLLVFLPESREPGRRVPAFLGLNFYGNHTVDSDPAIRLPNVWQNPESPIASMQVHRRGREAGKWPVETIVRRGYAVVTAYCGEICPDQPDGLRGGAAGWLTRNASGDRAPDAWGAVGAWAWGLSRALDYLETDADIDPARVVVHGHSRLGKAALWAAAQDQRFAAVISNNSGCGGAALSKRIHGETVAKINTVFPHWFALNFRRYNDRERDLPVDQHQLLALIAPRPLYVASAEADDWADPRGEFLAVRAAEPVFRMLGHPESDLAEMPLVNQPAGRRLRYHIREGGHDLTRFDWACYLDFADRWLRTEHEAGGKAPTAEH